MKSRKMHIGIGSLTMLMMFVVLCLTIFSVLSLITVDRDYKLTQKTVESMVGFYEADTKAEKRLAKIDEGILAAQMQMTSEPESDYLTLVSAQLEGIADIERIMKAEEEILRISYEEPLRTQQVLRVIVEVVPYGVSEHSRYHIVEWALKTNENWEEELNQPVFEELTLE